MPYLKCLSCMHEWEGKKDSTCSWCGSKGRILEKETSCEKAFKAYDNAQLLSDLMRITKKCS